MLRVTQVAMAPCRAPPPSPTSPIDPQFPPRLPAAMGGTTKVPENRKEPRKFTEPPVDVSSDSVYSLAQIPYLVAYPNSHPRKASMSPGSLPRCATPIPVTPCRLNPPSRRSAFGAAKPPKPWYAAAASNLSDRRFVPSLSKEPPPGNIERPENV